ncbi:MAG: hypothetical protein METHP_00359 [Methanoregula sp. SKADARSKE-2]|nr:MAG: hypothetical protein METHP_00359 [Methanoregula sp. SKADARSKE-2]
MGISGVSEGTPQVLAFKEVVTENPFNLVKIDFIRQFWFL